MNYGIWIYNKINIVLFLFLGMFEMFGNLVFMGKYCLVFVGVLCIIICYFECVYRISCDFLYIGTYLRDMFSHFVNKMSQKCEQFSYEGLFSDCCGFWGS